MIFRDFINEAKITGVYINKLIQEKYKELFFKKGANNTVIITFDKKVAETNYGAASGEINISYQWGKKYNKMPAIISYISGEKRYFSMDEEGVNEFVNIIVDEVKRVKAEFKDKISQKGYAISYSKDTLDECKTILTDMAKTAGLNPTGYSDTIGSAITFEIDNGSITKPGHWAIKIRLENSPNQKLPTAQFVVLLNTDTGRAYGDILYGETFDNTPSQISKAKKEIVKFIKNSEQMQVFL